MKLDWLPALIGRRVFSELHLSLDQKAFEFLLLQFWAPMEILCLKTHLVTPAWTLIRRGEGHLGDNLGTHYTQYQGESPLLTVIQSPQGGVCRKGDKR